ncbi:hypothetical protein C0Q70_03616 [Pomacea canaliculata]|uniref:Uncharacterized protein n=2 Tax=Pomacea canaliculata TaxID=400727 RepID=A0A2T7PTB3_POMCA|nr:hypothetical protein C0Q70_03616 [Pomacea canaliculata]
MDLQSFNETIAFLCDNSPIYLLGARCSANVSAEETKCQNTMTTELRQLEYQFQTLDISEAVFAADICRIRMDHTRCDLVRPGQKRYCDKVPGCSFRPAQRAGVCAASGDLQKSSG